MITRIICLLLVAVVKVGLLASCDRVTDLQPPVTQPPAVPLPVANEIKKLFPKAAEFELSAIEPNRIWGVGVQTDSAYSAALGQDGSFYGLYRRLPLAALPPVVQTILASHNGQKAFAVLSQQKQLTGYLVATPLGLIPATLFLFDPTGKLLARVSMGEQVLRNDLALDQVPFLAYLIGRGELPAAVQSAMNQRLSDSPVVFTVVSYSAGEKIVYVYARQGQTFLETYFDEQGNPVNYGSGGKPDPPVNFLNRGREELSIALRDSLDRRYPGWQLQKALTDSQGAWGLVINVGPDSYRIQLGKDWQFILANKL